MMRAILGACYVLSACVMAFGQTPEALSFEAASLKPSGPNSVRGSDGGPGSRDPERYTFNGAVLRDLLYNAYGLQDYQQQISGPGWIDAEKYDFTAKLPPNTTREQFQKMLQNLLAERLKVAVHHETRQVSVYELVVAKNGPRLKQSAGSNGPYTPGDGFPQLAAGRPDIIVSYGQDRARLAARQEPISRLVFMLRPQAGQPIVDKTGLTGIYDFTLEFGLRRSAAALVDEPVPILFDALEQQLGLKLVDAKAPFDVVVVDRAERVPTDN